VAVQITVPLTRSAGAGRAAVVIGPQDPRIAAGITGAPQIHPSLVTAEAPILTVGRPAEVHPTGQAKAGPIFDATDEARAAVCVAVTVSLSKRAGAGRAAMVIVSGRAA